MTQINSNQNKKMINKIVNISKNKKCKTLTISKKFAIRRI